MRSTWEGLLFWEVEVMRVHYYAEQCGELLNVPIYHMNVSIRALSAQAKSMEDPACKERRHSSELSAADESAPSQDIAAYYQLRSCYMSKPQLQKLIHGSVLTYYSPLSSPMDGKCLPVPSVLSARSEPADCQSDDHRNIIETAWWDQCTKKSLHMTRSGGSPPLLHTVYIANPKILIYR